MKRLVAFFEIPASDFDRAVSFYNSIMDTEVISYDFGHEKMAFFPKESGEYPGAISWSSAIDFLPSHQGVLVSLNCEDMDSVLSKVKNLGGKILQSKTKIEDEFRRYFSIILDSEGNRIGLYSEK